MEYEKKLILAYQGEVGGHILFCELAKHEANEAIRAVWSKVADMEALTRDRLEPLAKLRLGDLDEQRQQAELTGHERASRMVKQTWREIAEHYLPQTPGLIERFEALTAAAPEEERQVMEHVLEHSRAFSDCIRLCLDGQAQAAVDRIEAYLRA